ncbi:MAG: NAD(P)-dependent oxidoreductase [Deltaproteobacteria bacterium]|nr:NAD(P)-dependent oxidoreductase [Deltaproteobacteria bacterium]
MKLRAFVTGGHGFVGSHLVERLLKENFDVTCLIKPSSNLKWINTLPLKYFYGDLRDSESLKKISQDFDYVFHVAGLIQAKSEEEFFSVNEKGTLHLINACKSTQKNLKRFILISSIAASGPAAALKPRGEEDVENPVSTYGKSKLAGEKALKENAGTIAYTILRPPAIYGPRDRGIFFFFEAIKKLKGLPIFKPKNRYYSLIHVHDLVDAIYKSAISENAANQTFNIVNEKHYPLEEIVQKISFSLKTKPRVYYIPRPFVYGASFISDIITKLTKKAFHFNSMKMPDLEAQYWIFSAEKAKKELGWSNNIPLEKGLAETTHWYQKLGWL